MNTPKKRAQALVGLSILTVFFGIATGAFHAKADEPCKTQSALEDRDDIRANQKILEETRPAYTRLSSAVQGTQKINRDDVEDYNRFVDAKAWNHSESESLAKLGCRMDWDTLELVPFLNGEQ